MKTHDLAQLFVVASLIALSHPFLVGSALASNSVPFVGCAADGQMGPIDPPAKAAEEVDADQRAIQELAFYESSALRRGVLAPRRWHCFCWYGSSGNVLIVAPTKRVSQLGLDHLDTPAIVLGIYFGGTSGRFVVAKYARRLFPMEEPDFIQSVIDEGIEPAKDFPFGPYPKDKLIYRTKREVEFETPANQDGLGTSGLLRKGARPIYGVARLEGSASEELAFLLLTVRLPLALAHLRSAIIANVESSQ